MKRIGAVMLLMFTGVLPVSAQMLDNRECKVFTDDPFFNTDFIFRNKVKSMHGVLSTKKEMDRIRDGYLEYEYRFDSIGRLSSSFNAMESGSRIDTAVINYIYDVKGDMAILRRTDVHGFFSYHYEYDNLHRKSHETYYREENIGPSKFQFKLGKQYIIASESFKYDTINAKKHRVKYFNNYGKAYLEKISTYDDFGYLKEEAYRYILNNRRRTISYEYDEKGRTSKRTDLSTIGGKNEVVDTYTYDDIGNLVEQNRYRNGKHITVKSYLYDGRMLVSASVEKDVATTLITIIKYTYTFYEDPLPVTDRKQ